MYCVQICVVKAIVLAVFWLTHIFFRKLSIPSSSLGFSPHFIKKERLLLQSGSSFKPDVTSFIFSPCVSPCFQILSASFLRQITGTVWGNRSFWVSLFSGCIPHISATWVVFRFAPVCPRQTLFSLNHIPAFHPFIMLISISHCDLTFSIPAWFYLPLYFAFTVRNGLNAAVFYRQNAPHITIIILFLYLSFWKEVMVIDVEIFTLHNGQSLRFHLCSLIREVLLESSVRSCMRSFSSHIVLLALISPNHTASYEYYIITFQLQQF